MILGQVLQLHIAPSPASGAVGPVELERAAHTPVRTGGVTHGDILFHAGLGQLLPQGDGFLSPIRQQFQHRLPPVERTLHFHTPFRFGSFMIENKCHT